MSNSELKLLQQLVRRRQTSKVLGCVDQPVVYQKEDLARFDAIVEQAIADSGWAPFHYDRGVDGVAEPWRVHWLGYADCRRLAADLKMIIPNLKATSKMPQLLSGCGCLVLFNWIPQTTGSDDRLARINEEHLAATAAVVENFILLLTAAEFETYWSSGSAIEEAFLHLGIRSIERLLAAVFVHYPGGSGNVDKIGGKQRSRRSAPEAWCRHAHYRDPP